MTIMENGKMSELTRIISNVVIHRPVEQVFAFGTTPRYWPDWHPTAVSVHGAIDRPVTEGDEILEYERLAFLTGSISWRVRLAAAPARWIIDGVVNNVPFFHGTTTSITYTLESVAAGTRLHRDMTYRVPNAFGRLLDHLYFSAHNARQSQRAVEGMKRILESI
jgi:hypothetical protein